MGPLFNFLKLFQQLNQKFSTNLSHTVSSKYQFKFIRTISFDQLIIFYELYDHKEFLIELFLKHLIQISILTASDVGCKHLRSSTETTKLGSNTNFVSPSSSLTKPQLNHIICPKILKIRWALRLRLSNILL